MKHYQVTISYEKKSPDQVIVFADSKASASARMRKLTKQWWGNIHGKFTVRSEECHG